MNHNLQYMLPDANMSFPRRRESRIFALTYGGKNGRNLRPHRFCVTLEWGKETGESPREEIMKSGKDAVPSSQIEDRIYTIRSKRVMLDSDLAALYGVTTSRLNEQVSRNPGRFPEDFAFSLEKHEVTDLMSQIATSSGNPRRHGGRRKTPRVFTEHGAIMAASVLNTPRAVEVSVFVVRAFVKLRELAMAHKEIRQKLSELEQKVTGHDQAIAGLIHAIRELMTPPEPKKKRPIGFSPWNEK